MLVVVGAAPRAVRAGEVAAAPTAIRGDRVGGGGRGGGGGGGGLVAVVVEGPYITGQVVSRYLNNHIYSYQ